MKIRPLLILLGLAWGAASAYGAAGLIQRLLTGHELANYGSYVPWGLWVAEYIYFVGLSAGAFLLSSLVYVFGVKRLEPIGKLALFTAFVTLLSALLAIWLDLGHPFRFWNVYTSPQPTSMMAWMVWLYTGYFLLVMAELWLALRGDLVTRSGQSGPIGRLAGLLTFGFRDATPVAQAADRRRLRILGILGIPLAVAFHGGVGALFGVIGARPYWNTSLFPIIFLISALASGGALLTFVVAYFWPAQQTQQHRDTVSLLGRLTLGLLAFDLLMEWAEVSINLYAAIPAHSDAYRAMLFGPFWWVFWIGHLALGSALPIALLALFPRSPKIVGAAGGIIAALFITVRTNIVVPGLVIPELRGLERAYTDARLTFSYMPSLLEYQVALFVATLGVALFFLGYWLLPLVHEGSASATRQEPVVPRAGGD